MGKAYINLCYRQKSYKVDPKDIRKVYKIEKGCTPKIPFFDSANLNFTSTDTDIDLKSETTL